MLWMWMRRKSSRCKPGDHAQSDREDCVAAHAPFEPFAAFIIIGERAAHEAARAGATPPRARGVLNSVTTTYRLPGKRFQTRRRPRSPPALPRICFPHATPLEGGVYGPVPRAVHRR